MENLNKMKAIIEAAEVDAAKFTSNGNSSAGTRIRKAMQDIKNLAQTIRIEVQEAKNSKK